MRTLLKVSLIGSVAAAGSLLASGAFMGSTPEASSSGTRSETVRATSLPADKLAPDRVEMSLSFEENRGQVGPQVDFVARAPNFTAYFSGGSIDFALPSPVRGAELEAVESAGRRFDVAGAGMRFLGVREDLRLEAGNLLENRMNYLRGQDPSKYITGIPTYSTVSGHDAWPGIDLGYASKGAAFEYSFKVAPGADAGAIAFEFAGADGLAVDEAGNLTIDVAGGTLTHTAPVAWQEKDGTAEPVAVAFRTGNDGVVGFDIGAHDASRDLFIDPSVSFAYYRGGQGDDYFYGGVAVDTSGNLYVAGTTVDSGPAQDFPYTTDLTHLGTGVGTGGSSDIIVVRFGSGGVQTWATIVGGEAGQNDGANGVAVDTSAPPRAHITGYTNSANYPVSATPFQGSLNGSYDAVVTVLSGNGTAIAYSTYLGGTAATAIETGSDLGVDSSGNIHVVGTTDSSDFTAASNSLSGTRDAFYAVMDFGGTLSYMEYVGGTLLELGFGLSIDGSDNVYLCGDTTSVNFPTLNAYDTTKGGSQDGWVRAYDNTQTAFFSTYLGGSFGEQALGIQVDGNGDPWVTGYTLSTNFPVVNPAQKNNGGGRDAFLSKLHFDTGTSTTTLDYSTYFGGTLNEEGVSIGFDVDGIASVGGNTKSTDLPLISAQQITFGGNTDGFLARIDPELTPSRVMHATYLGGTANDFPFGIVADPTGKVTVVGWTNSSNFPASNSNAGKSDGFVTRYQYEAVDLVPYQAQIRDSVTALKDDFNLKFVYSYTNRAGVLKWDTSKTLIVTLTVTGQPVLTLNTSTGTGSWNTKVTQNGTGDVVYTWNGKDNVNRKWRIRMIDNLSDPNRLKMEIYGTNFTFPNPITTGLGPAPSTVRVLVSVDWDTLTAFHSSPFRNSITFNNTKFNAVLRKP